jgi:hypothetical protein
LGHGKGDDFAFEVGGAQDFVDADEEFALLAVIFAAFDLR